MILRMSDTKHLDEFMTKLGRTKNMAMSEPLVYGPLIGDMKGSTKPLAFVEKYSSAGHPVEARLAALGYYYKNGTANDLAKVERYSDDKQKVPTCAEDATDCEWECTIQVKGAPEAKQVETVGDFVNYCVKPAMEKRAATKTEQKEEK